MKNSRYRAKMYLKISTFAQYRLFLLQNNDICRFIVHIRFGKPIDVPM